MPEPPYRQRRNAPCQQHQAKPQPQRGPRDPAPKHQRTTCRDNQIQGKASRGLVKQRPDLCPGHAGTGGIALALKRVAVKGVGRPALAVVLRLVYCA